MTTQPVKLPYRFLKITGKDADKFLQGQCSVDLASLDENHFSFGTFNTPKGRIYGLFKLLKISDGLLLALNSCTFETVIARLKKYAAFFKCSLEDAEYSAYGLTQVDVITSLPINSPETPNKPYEKTGPEGDLLIKLPGNKDLLQYWTTNPIPSSLDTQESIENWNACEAEEGIPELYTESLEQFILQELNLQKLNAVSFTKGCYTGQEIIARMKYLGKQKKRMYLLVCTENSNEISTPTSPVYIKAKEGKLKKAGFIVRGHKKVDGTQVALAVLNTDVVGETEVAYTNQEMTTSYEIKELSYTD